MADQSQHSIKDDDAGNRIARLLLVASLVYAGFFVFRYAQQIVGADGLLIDAHAPLGGDFINLWTVAELVLSGDWGAIYDYERLMAVQQAFVGAEIGIRTWVYPPHSLLFVWPFGFLPYLPALLVWNLIGLAVLGFGARRYGLGWQHTLILALSPAALFCVEYGQTGNLLCGLFLIALSHRSARAPLSITAAALMTIKPQIGFLLPLVWLFRRAWWLIAATAVLAIALVALSFAIFGVAAWQDYVGITMPALTRLETEGVGPFMYMIGSAFMSFRLLGEEGNRALMMHLVFAVPVFSLLVWRLSKTTDEDRRAALVLIATALITPYLHVYDYSIILAGALIAFRPRATGQGGRYVLALIGLALAWLLPTLVLPLGVMGVPITPLLVLAVFFIF